MPSSSQLLKTNRNYRYTWSGQVVSEIGDHFNNVAVFSLALANTRSGLVVTGIMLSRAIPAVMAGPVAGVLLDRLDRKRIMIASDLIRAVVAIGFILAIPRSDTWLLYLLSALLMFASPFFTSGRSAILPTIASKEELHTANSLTQTTQWMTLTIGAFLGGTSVTQFGYKWAFTFNAFSFLFSAACISRLRIDAAVSERERTALTEDKVVRPWHEYTEGLRYMRASPLILGLGAGWHRMGFRRRRGADSVQPFWRAGFQSWTGGHRLSVGRGRRGLAGGRSIRALARQADFVRSLQAHHQHLLRHPRRLLRDFQPDARFPNGAAFPRALSSGHRGQLGLNMSQLLRHVSNEFRGRVFATMETMQWSTMMLSMAGAGVASQTWSPRSIGVVSGLLSSSTAFFWLWANWTGRLPEPAREGVEPEEIEVHGDPVV